MRHIYTSLNNSFTSKKNKFSKWNVAMKNGVFEVQKFFLDRYELNDKSWVCLNDNNKPYVFITSVRGEYINCEVKNIISDGVAKFNLNIYFEGELKGDDYGVLSIPFEMKYKSNELIYRVKVDVGLNEWTNDLDMIAKVVEYYAKERVNFDPFCDYV